MTETAAELAAPARRGYSLRSRVALGAVAAIGFALFTAVLTALIDSPLLVRKIAPEWWVWPSLVATSVLGGALVTLSLPVDTAEMASRLDATASLDTADTRGAWGAGLSFLAVGCPVCNKIVLLAVGSSGALRWFAPIQPYLALASIALLVWALVYRLRNRDRCAI
ncbi:MAG: hypothetical protein ACRBI6_02185 [Acidimicrobiales bacterium]